MKKIVFLFLVSIVIGCSPSTAQDCQREAKGIMKSLTADLREVQSREDLIDREDQIEQKAEALVTLMIRLKKLQERGIMIPEEEDHTVSDALMHEMKRVYYIQGGRELIERFQREALLKLDAFDQKRKK